MGPIKPCKIATWNVNSLRARKDRVLRWLSVAKPDILCLQEIKMLEEQFPKDEFREAGYASICVGQKGYNGVAILCLDSLGTIEQISTRLPDSVDDEPARMLHARVEGLGMEIICIYVPNGQDVLSEKFSYKLEWLGRLKKYIKEATLNDRKVLIAGDCNVAPEDRDVHDAEAWRGTVICDERARRALSAAMEPGFVDTLRLCTQDAGIFTYWDYQQLAFPRNHGIRIDHVWASSNIASFCKRAWVDRDERKGEKPSDHVPYVVEFG